MIFVVIVKEIRDNISNLRFSAGTMLTAILTILCVVVLTNQYRQEAADYRTRLVLQDEFIAQYAHTNRVGVVSQPERPPETLAAVVRMGIEASNLRLGGCFVTAFLAISALLRLRRFQLLATSCNGPASVA